MTTNTFHPIHLTLDVLYDLQGESADELKELLERNLRAAIGNGLLTGHTAAEVDQHSFTATVLPPQPELTLKAPVTVFVEAFNTSDSGATPGYAMFTVDPALCEMLRKMRNLCFAHNLTEVRGFDCPRWGPGNIEEEMQLADPALVVTRSEFWFRDTPKHALGHVETRSMHIDAFIHGILQGKQYFGNDPEALARYVAQHALPGEDDVNEPACVPSP